jgi:hypothetical protein
VIAFLAHSEGESAVSYQLSVTHQPTYLHIIVTGQNSPDTVSRYMDEVVRECSTRGCRRVLVEERLTGARLGTVEVFRLVSAGSVRLRGALQAMAYVDVNGMGVTMQFAENVAVNRAFPVRVFSSVAAAEKWLQDSAPPAAVTAPEKL